VTLARPAKFNRRIGGKLIIMSAVGVLLVAAMIVPGRTAARPAQIRDQP